jgi:hypothetical protein
MNLFQDYTQKSYLLFMLQLAGSKGRHPGYAFMSQSKLSDKQHMTVNHSRYAA